MFTYGSPSDTIEMSHDVPPRSTHSRLPRSISLPKCALAMVPAAGPANTISNGCSIAMSALTSCAAQFA